MFHFRHLTPSVRMIVTTVFFVGWIAYFSLFWWNAFSQDHDGNVFTTNVNMWGDWAAHFTMGSHMAYKELLPTTSPFIINHRFSYPFAANLLSAILIKIGVPFFASFTIPSFVFSVVTIFALYLLYKALFKSWTVALLASCIFLFNGGLGFTYYISDIATSPTPMYTALNPPQEYTNLEELRYRWISVIQSMIIPQRAFTMGFPIALLSLYALLQLFYRKKIRTPMLIGIGIAIGMLPLIHTHSFLVVSTTAALWALCDIATSTQRTKKLILWGLTGIVALILSSSLFWFFFYGQVSQNFVTWFPGWYSREFTDEHWVWFWIKNWGFVPLFAGAGLVVLVKQSSHRLRTIGLFLPFFIQFAALNLVLFQPFIWDNTKILVWASVGFSGLTAYLFIHLFQTIRKKILAKRVVGYIAISVMLSITMCAGVIDAYRIIRFPIHTYQMYSAEEMILADWAKQTTDANSVWLTGDVHNHWMYNLTGRQSLLTFRGWLWTHGYNYSEVEADTAHMFQEPAEHLELFEKYNVSYIVVGYNERKVWQANTKELQNVFPKIKETTNYVIFARKPSSPPR